VQVLSNNEGFILSGARLQVARKLFVYRWSQISSFLLRGRSVAHFSFNVPFVVLSGVQHPGTFLAEASLIWKAISDFCMGG
jgi:hypothetical protein